MAVVLITGMSGTGKAAALAELERKGHRVVDTDHGGWTEQLPSGEARDSDPLWREPLINELLANHDDGTLFIAGCVRNQSRFYPLFDAVVLLSAPAEVLLDRVATRTTNDFGKTETQRRWILEDLALVEPLLRVGATAEIDTRAPLDEVVAELQRIAAAADSSPRA